jgi:hypothetical protein
MGRRRKIGIPNEFQCFFDPINGNVREKISEFMQFLLIKNCLN